VKPLKIHFLHTHPIQYHSPLFDRMHQDERIDLKVYYCSDYGLSIDGQRYHPEFGTLPNWDVDLVGQHPHHILKNYAFKKGIFKGFFGLMNFGLIRELYRDKPDVLVINGWNYFTLIFAMLCCKVLGISNYLRGDNTLNFDLKLSTPKLKLKRLILGSFLFRCYARICYVGENNKAFFKAYGVNESKLIHLPHAIDNERFRNYFVAHRTRKEQLKQQLKISGSFNLLFVGRLHESKCVIDLLRVMNLVDKEIHLLIVGDGLQYEQLNNYIQTHKLRNCHLLGFKNQKEIMSYYLVADTFVLPSNYLETWGLVVNEAMNFNLPVLLSDEVGCAPDLCTTENGYIFQNGDINTLADKITYLYKNPNIAKIMGIKSGELIPDYSYDSIIERLVTSINN
jgi:glycosyltransferase involved in cell wall biosynthesis